MKNPVDNALEESNGAELLQPLVTWTDIGVRELIDKPAAGANAAEHAEDSSPEWQQLFGAPSHAARASALPSVVVGELVAIADEGRTPLVLYPGQPGSAALRARTVVAL